MAEEIKVALVGIGGYGEFYAAELFRSAAHYGVRLVAGIDPFAKSSSLFKISSLCVVIRFCIKKLGLRNI